MSNEKKLNQAVKAQVRKQYNANLYQAIINDANKLNNNMFIGKKSVIEFLKSYDIQNCEYSFIKPGVTKYDTPLVITIENFHTYSIWF